MNCIFFGHKDTPLNIKQILENSIKYMINTLHIKRFFVGNNGNFDFLVQRVLKQIASTTDINYSIVISHINETTLSGDENASLFPEGLEKALPKFAISKRNEWLLQNASFAIVYMKNKFSNCYKWVQKANKKGLTIINLANDKCLSDLLK
ncbi:MAG: hypothetical protein IJ398_03405 [Clostridia bacterium]|nr:hypothetical protein [Clostridia bacterium]